jgi:hypothetical protein
MRFMPLGRADELHINHGTLPLVHVRMCIFCINKSALHVPDRSAIAQMGVVCTKRKRVLSE